MVITEFRLCLSTSFSRLNQIPYTRSWSAIEIIFKALFLIGFRPTAIFRLLRNSSRQIHGQTTATAGAGGSGDLEGLGAMP